MPGISNSQTDHEEYRKEVKHSDLFNHIWAETATTAYVSVAIHRGVPCQL